MSADLPDTGEAAYSGSTDIRDLIQAPYPLIEQSLFKQTFQLIDVNQLPEDELQQQQWAGMMALMMKHSHDRDILLFLKQILEPLRQLEQLGGTDFVVVLLNYCLNTGETVNIQEFVTLVQQGLSHETGERVMTIAEQLIEKGKIEGRAEGKAEGRAEGKAEGRAEGKAEGRAEGELQTIRKLAESAFCEKLSLEIVQKLTGLTVEELQKIQAKIKH